ncbi:endoribonuclease CG2145-like [Bombus pascuorum]|uniref:endoribonuclease CG2145-like n=1 Tax=Bombus pascuorum TaxID=65598 RepID=UPI00213B9C52|nr:endoribonuclease CG2145-like [Bombus pascuorum]
MKFKTITYFLIFICVFFVIYGTSAKYRFGSKTSFGKGSFHGSTHGRSRGTSHGTSRGSLSGTSHRIPYGGTSNGANSNQRVHEYGVSNSKPSHPTGNSAGSTEQNKNINTDFLKAEGGGATRPGHATIGQANPAWSNPYLRDNKPTAPAQQHSLAYSEANKSPVPNSLPAAPGFQPPPIGFKYPQTHSTSGGTYPTNPIHISSNPISHPNYPTNPIPSGNPYSTHSSSFYPANSMPLGNPYSIHPSGPAFNVPGHSPFNYPQQTHVLAQPAVQPFVPGQTILMTPGQQDSGRGFGQMVKEALVFSTINAGVNRLINPHTHYVETKPADSAPPTPTTHVTYNNQYFNTVSDGYNKMNPANVPQGTEFPISPTGLPNFPNGPFTSNVGGNNIPSSGSASPNIPDIPSSTTRHVFGSGINENVTSPTGSNNPANINKSFDYTISDDELFRISEELFAKNSRNMNNYIKMNLQTRVTSSNITDEAKKPLFEVDPELLEYPSIYAIRTLYDSYEYDSRKKLNRTLEIRKQENLLLDIFLNTNEMSRAMEWLADRGFIAPDDFERKDVLRRIWFTVFNGSTCGFERVFASEKYGTAIIGVQDWIYFENQESLKRIDYMGYVDKLDLGSTASLVKLNFQQDGNIRQNATIFVGTLPELEMALYTICFYARSNDLCPVSLGATKFTIYTHSFIYFGIQIIDFASPMF